MANSMTTGARVEITAEYPSKDEPLEFLMFHHLKAPATRISTPCGGIDMRTSTLNEISSQNELGDGNPFEKPRKIIGQKPDKAKFKLLKEELLSCEEKVLQNLNSPVRFRPAPSLVVIEAVIGVPSRAEAKDFQFRGTRG